MQIKGGGGQRRNLFWFAQIGCAMSRPNTASADSQSDKERQDVRIPPRGLLDALRAPKSAGALVVFVHGSGSTRLSPRNILVVVARALNNRGIATLLFDLLTSAEEGDRANVFNIPLLAERLVEVIAWLDRDPFLTALPLGLFGASTGAVVSRGGRPDLAGYALDDVHGPTLLIVGGDDFEVIDPNEHAMARLSGPRLLQIIPYANHRFPEPGALRTVIDHAAGWFKQYLSLAHSVLTAKVRKKRAGRR